MRFMMFIKHPKDYGDLQVPEALYGAMGAFIEEHAKKGQFIDGAGLLPLAKGTRVKLSKGKITVVDGPFAEAKEVVGGYGVIEAASHAEAVELAAKFMQLHLDHWPEFEGESEVRPFEAMDGPPQG